MKRKKFKMKRSAVFLLILSTILFSSFGSIDTLEMDDVVVALKSGNASQLSKYFDSRVDIGLPDKSDNYSRTQGEMVIKDFFGSNGVRNFELKYKSEKGGANYCVGTLQTRNGNYRTTLFMRQKGDRQYLQDISFQKAD
ncbi:MAG: DUF4783 domain-containing protein [Chitinophagaceae bacterium]